MIDSNRLEEWLRNIDELRTQLFPGSKFPGQLANMAAGSECP
jgi:hypothetical protein